MKIPNDIEKLIQYFFLLTKNHLLAKFGPDIGESMSNNFNERFRVIWSANFQRMPTPITMRFGINPIFVIALHDVLTKGNVPISKLKKHVLAIYRVMMSAMIENQRKSLKESEDQWSAFVSSTKQGNKSMYENKYFELETVLDTESQFGFDINRCYYFEILQENGYPELGPILCDFDYLMHEAAQTWVSFQRDETIADGKPRCTFRYSRL